jgi:hypothetical protein
MDADDLAANGGEGKACGPGSKPETEREARCDVLVCGTAVALQPKDG